MNTGMKTSATMNKKRFSEIISLVWLIICFAAACYYVARYNTLFIDADMSSELVLAKLLSEEGGILSKSWYYSTELRILNTQLIFAPLFAVIDDWSLVRAIGTAICLFFFTSCATFSSRALFTLGVRICFSLREFLCFRFPAAIHTLSSRGHFIFRIFALLSFSLA